MARPPAFDRERALNQATKLFWARGYHATALPDLLETMGIARSSFYAAFGDKRSLFAECLRRFGRRTLEITHAAQPRSTDTADAGEMVRGFFAATILDVAPDRLRNGCLLVNSVLELADTDPELSRLSAQHLGDIEDAFEQAFDAALSNGTLRSLLSARDLARCVMTLNQGLRVQSRKRVPRETLWSTVENTLALLGLSRHAA
ncbi:MAG: TetR/AcrR family transcriptional regulator [Nevskiales bacterium]|nr:TetR/AcrR family transcriptional regulator [Nevskiales bacterium]